MMTLITATIAAAGTQRGDLSSPVPSIFIVSAVGICAACYEARKLFVLGRVARPLADQLHIFSQAMLASLVVLIASWCDVVLALNGDPPAAVGLIVICAAGIVLLMVAGSRWLEKHGAPLVRARNGDTMGRQLIEAARLGVVHQSARLWAHARQTYELPESSVRGLARESRRLGYFGRFGVVLVVAALFAAGVFVRSALAIPSSQSAVFVRSASLYGAAVVLCMTPPVALAWLVLSICHGRPRIVRTLKRAAEVVGIGTMCGLLVGSVSFAANLGLAATDSQTPTPDLSFDLLFSLSLAGAAFGFGLSHFVVIYQAAAGLPKQPWGWLAGPAALGVAVSVTQHGPFTPRVVAARLIDAATRGVVISGNSASLPAVPLWRAYFLVSRASIVRTLPTRLEYGVLLVAGALVLPVAAAIATWRATSDEPAEPLYRPRHAASG